MTDLAPQRVSLAGGVDEALARLPLAAGVAGIEDPDGQSLLIARSANIRKWAASNLGRGPAVAAGKRPKTDMSAVARAVAWVVAETPFERTLVYERWMAPLVPYAKRKDLRPPHFLRLDLSARFPRVVAVGEPGEGAFGPFRDRKAAERASGALHKVFPLRPCDHAFEPAEDLPLGRSCLYAQVRSCAAPCLRRVSEDAYREIASDVARLLASPSARAGLLSDGEPRSLNVSSVAAPKRSALAAALPVTISAALGRGLVVEKARAGGVLHAVCAGRVLDAVRFAKDEAEAALASVSFARPEGAPEDWPWLATWLHSPAGRASFVVDDGTSLVRAVLERIQ